MTESKPDSELLKSFALQGDETAFRELVTRHADLVFGTAFRKLQQRPDAEEVAQNVFNTMALKAPAGFASLAASVAVTGVAGLSTGGFREPIRHYQEPTPYLRATPYLPSNRAMVRPSPIEDQSLSTLRR